MILEKAVRLSIFVATVRFGVAAWLILCSALAIIFYFEIHGSYVHRMGLIWAYVILLVPLAYLYKCAVTYSTVAGAKSFLAPGLLPKRLGVHLNVFINTGLPGKLEFASTCRAGISIVQRVGIPGLEISSPRFTRPLILERTKAEALIALDDLPGVRINDKPQGFLGYALSGLFRLHVLLGAFSGDRKWPPLSLKNFFKVPTAGFVISIDKP